MLKFETKKWDCGCPPDVKPVKEFRLEISTAWLLVLFLPLVFLIGAKNKSPFIHHTNHTYNVGTGKGGNGHGED